MERDPLRLCLDALTHRPSGLVTDVDGTISPITSPPSAASVDPVARRALDELTAVLDVVAVVSGRDARDARRMVGLDGVVYLGNHGMERLDGTGLAASPLAEPYREIVHGAVDALRHELSIPGVAIEDKGVTASVHYRACDDPHAAELTVVPAVARVAESLGLRLTHGRMVVELRPPLDLNKGTAVRDLALAHGLRGVVFIGDDRTDVDAMTAVEALRADGALDGVSVGVVGPETPPHLLECADATVAGVDGVANLLAKLVEGLRRPAGGGDRR